MSTSESQSIKFVGVEVSPSHLTAVHLDAGRNIIGEISREVDFREPSSLQVVAFVDSLKQRFGHFDRVGIAVPGLVAPDRRSVAYSVHIPEHSGADLASAVEKSTGISTVIDNDANAAAYAEFQIGAGRGAKNMFYATLGTGVGGSFIFGGAIWRGAGGFAGEFGYVPINSEGLRLEDVASAANIIRRTRSRFHQDNTSSLIELDENAITVSDIVAAAEAQDDFAKLMLERTGNYVGTGLASVINLLNIERIVVGGEIMRAEHVILEAIVSRARELSYGPSFSTTQIIAGELGPHAAAAGAALLSADAV